MVGHLSAGVVAVEAIRAVVELLAQPAVVRLVFTAVGATMHVEVSVDAGLHLLAHLFAVDSLSDLGAAAGAERERKGSDQGQGQVAQRRSHDDWAFVRWCEASPAVSMYGWLEHDPFQVGSP